MTSHRRTTMLHLRAINHQVISLRHPDHNHLMMLTTNLLIFTSIVRFLVSSHQLWFVIKASCSSQCPRTLLQRVGSRPVLTRLLNCKRLHASVAMRVRRVPSQKNQPTRVARFTDARHAHATTSSGPTMHLRIQHTLCPLHSRTRHISSR